MHPPQIVCTKGIQASYITATFNTSYVINTYSTTLQTVIAANNNILDVSFLEDKLTNMK
jgi:hypothetical protein